MPMTLNEPTTDVETPVEVDLDVLIEDLTGDTRTHMINPVDNLHVQQFAGHSMSSQEIADFAKAHNIEIKAICGYIWVPKRNVESYPICESCLEIAHRWMEEDGA